MGEFLDKINQVWIVQLFGKFLELFCKSCHILNIKKNHKLPYLDAEFMEVVHTLNTKKTPFQSKQSKHFHQRNRFT